MSPDVSIVIVNWNACDLLRDCLRSITNETDRSHEVFVIDNASSDGSVSMVERECPDVQLIANHRNVGFAAANNQGIAQASGKFVLLLNPDTVILSGAIDRMIEFCEKHPDVGCAGCQVLTDPETIQRTCFRDLSPLNLLLIELGLCRSQMLAAILGRAEYAEWDRRTERDVQVVSGMFMLVRREVIDAVGLLDEAFFIYAEEADWCLRIRQAGYRCVFTPVGQILHLDGGGKCTSQVKPQMYVQLQKSKLIFARKHYGLVGWSLAKCIVMSSMTVRCILHRTIGVVTRNGDQMGRARLAWAALRFHLFRIEVVG